jgi:oligopeptide transport system substrate-binding protein
MIAWITRVIVLACLAGGLWLFHQSRVNRPQRVEIANQENVLLVGNGTDIESLDPNLAIGQPDHYVITTLFEGLVGPAEDDPDKTAPGVALSWHSEDFVHWTFKLNPKASWSDGVPITAADFLYAWQRILSPALAADYANMLYLLKGGEAFHRGDTKDFSAVGVQAPDAHTLEIELVGPAPFFPGMLKHYSWFPVPKHAIEKFGTMTQRDTLWARPGNLVCNGPFTLKEWRINHFISVEKNPRYWDADKVALREIRFFPIENYEAEERIFLDGQLHVTYTVPLAKIPQYRASRPPYFYQSPELATEFYRCNVIRPPMDNPKIRHALALSVDRVALVDQVIRSGHLAATGFVPPRSHPDYPPLERLRFDPAEARRLLAEAGFPGGRGFRKVEILTNTSPSARTVAEFFQESWKKHLGIEVGILQQEWQVYLDSQRNLNYDICRAGWVGDYIDPYTFVGCFESDSGNNNTGWKNARYDELLLASSRERDPAARLQYMRDAENLLLDEMPIIPVFWRMNSHLIRPEVINWKLSVSSHRCYKAIRLGPFTPLSEPPLQQP